MLNKKEFEFRGKICNEFLSKMQRDGINYFALTCDKEMVELAESMKEETSHILKIVPNNYTVKALIRLETFYTIVTDFYERKKDTEWLKLLNMTYERANLLKILFGSFLQLFYSPDHVWKSPLIDGFVFRLKVDNNNPKQGQFVRIMRK